MTALRYILTLLVLLYTCSAYAQNEGRWYTVEVLIFKNVNGNQQTQEIWPEDVKLNYPESFRYLATKDSGNFSLLPQNQLQLGAYNYALRKQEKYQVLFHRAWTQQMQNEERSPAIIINGGKTIADQTELSGYITIHIGRYLHLNTDLWLTHFATATTSTQWPEIPLAPGAATTVTGFSGKSSNLPIATMRGKRRMRSNELHYLDHPLMGLLILITPLK